METRRPTAAAVLCGAVVLVSACAVAGPGARPTEPGGMAMTAADVPGPPSPAIAGGVAVRPAAASVAAKTYPEESASFQQALVQSLRVAGLLSEQPTAPLAVEASLVDAGGGGDLAVTVTLKVRYTVRETGGGGAVIDEVITTSHTATTSDSLAGAGRRRIATDKAARKSLAALVKRLNTIRRK